MPNRLFENVYNIFPWKRDSKNNEIRYLKSFYKYLQTFNEKKLRNNNNTWCSRRKFCDGAFLWWGKQHCE